MIQIENGISERLILISNSEPMYQKTENKRNDKYSLRPRSTRRKLSSDEEEEENANSSTKNKKAKQKPAPLSKYRRKTANVRERNRMREINKAFETLQKVVPLITPQQQQNEKLTKITTLRLAMKYISTLSEILGKNKSYINLSELFGKQKNSIRLSQILNNENSDHGDCETFSDGESLVLHSDVSDQSVTSSDFSVELSSDSFGITAMGFEGISTEFSENFDAYWENFS